MVLTIKFNMNLQLCLLQKWICLEMRLSSYWLSHVSGTTLPIIILCFLAKHEHPLTIRPPNTILFKPRMISNYQQILNSKIYKSKLTIRSAHKLVLQPWEYAHEVWFFHMVDSILHHGLTHIAMPKTIYLQSELKSAKHFVSLYAYNISLLQQSLKHFQNYKTPEFKHFHLLTYQYHQTHLLHMNHNHAKIARYSHINNAI